MTARWYIVHAYSNFEKKVAEDIENKAKQKGLSSDIEQIVVPTEKVVEVRRGRKVDAERKFFPGYVLLEGQSDRRGLLAGQEHAEGHRLPRVDNSKPVPITEKRSPAHPEPGSGRRRAAEAVGHVRDRRAIRVSDGPFASFNGFVQEVDEERARLKVEVSIFGRAVPVDLEFGQVEKG